MAANTPSSRQGLRIEAPEIWTYRDGFHYLQILNGTKGYEHHHLTKWVRADLAAANRAPATEKLVETMALMFEALDEVAEYMDYCQYECPLPTSAASKVRLALAKYRLNSAALAAATGTEPTEQVKP